jgi:hypothetical protein
MAESRQFAFVLIFHLVGRRPRAEQHNNAHSGFA